MNFNFNSFIEGISDYREKSGPINIKAQKVSLILNHIFSDHKVKDIDFDRFSLEDVVYTLEAMESVEHSYVSDSDEVFFMAPNNPVTEIISVQNVVFEFINSRNKIYQSIEEEFFI